MQLTAQQPEVNLIPVGQNHWVSTATPSLSAAVERPAGCRWAPARLGETCASTLSIVPANTSPMYHRRRPHLESLPQLEIRVRACFDPGELASGCAHEVTQARPAINPTIAVDWGDAVHHRPEFATPSADRAVCDRALALLTAAGGAV